MFSPGPQAWPPPVLGKEAANISTANGSRWCMPKPDSSNTSLCPVILVAALLSWHGWQPQLWLDAARDTCVFLGSPLTLGFLVGLFVFLHFLPPLSDSSMAGKKTAPAPRGSTTRFRSVAAVVFVLSVLAYGWQRLTWNILSPGSPPPEMPPTQPTSGNWIDFMTGGSGQALIAVIALVVVVVSFGSINKPSKPNEAQSKLKHK